MEYLLFCPATPGAIDKKVSMSYLLCWRFRRHVKQSKRVRVLPLNSPGVGENA
jgi:hypothetical protein